MDLKHYMERCRASVDKQLLSLLPSKDMRPEKLHQAMHYSVFAGGKRIRPILMIASCEAVGGDISQVLPTACAMEMIHTYSLIHDDLPAMDDDNFRRGIATNHKVFGEDTAILAGDALLTQAFITLSAATTPITIDKQTQVLNIIATASGAAGMVGGQVIDMEAEGDVVDLDTVNYIHSHKTGALILASIQCGALIGGADKKAFTALTSFGQDAGLAFQIADDILDIEGNQQQLGKDIGSDQQRGKATYPAVMGVEKSRQRMEQLQRQAMDKLIHFGDNAEALRQISQYIINRSS
ncbi:MAG: polyprenyl synthetase [Desulfobacteraceae bacterium 4572_35.1]|nr:MAG: polyprenyl synthetase [Desulfobacteraceae bacterium 4572_35.1]